MEQSSPIQDSNAPSPSVRLETFPAPRDWGRWVVAGSGLLVALFALWMPFHWGGPEWVAPINDVTNVLLGLALVALTWRASTTVGLPTHRRRGWRLFALACLAYWLGNCRWLYNELVLGETPYPSLADAGYLTFIPLALTAVLFFVGPIESRAERARIWIDAATVMVGIGAAIWYFLIYPIYQSGFDSPLELLIAEAYPVGDTLLLFGVSALLLKRRPEGYSRPFGWLAAGLALHLAADSLYGYLELRSQYEGGGLTDLLYNLSYFLMMLGAHLQRSHPKPVTCSAERPPDGLGSSLIPYAAILFAYGLLFGAPQDLWHSGLGGLAVAVALLAALAVTRQHLWAREYTRLRAEQASQEGEARLAAIFAHAPIGMALLGPDQRISAVNRALAHFLGRSSEELVGEPLTRFAHPQDGVPLAAVLADRTGAERLSARFLRPNGETILGDTRAIGLPAHGDTPPLPLAMVEDVTALESARQALEQSHHHLEFQVTERTRELRVSEERLRLILESSADGLIGVDLDVRITFANPAAEFMLGWPEGELLGQDLSAVVRHGLHGTDADDEDQSATLEILGTENTHRVEGAQFRRRDGTAFAVSYAARSILRDGVLSGAVLAFSDATLRREAELAAERARAEAEHLARVKGDFLANMSHEIRTPLNGVLGLAQIGWRRSADHPKLQRDFGGILESGRMLLAIVNDILDFSKIEAGKLTIESIPFETARVIDQVVESLGSRAKERGIGLSRSLAPDFPTRCQGDPVRLAQILSNLVSNAVKFTQAGWVDVEAERAGDRLIYRVSDTGIGMDSSQIERLFAPFEQADSGTTRRFGGTGLGLAITRRLVDLMDGKIRVESLLGQGTRFEIELPYREAQCELVDVVPGVPAAAGPGLAGLRLLIAEDNEVNQVVIEEMLSAEGARTTLVGDGRAAVEAVAADPSAWDAVLMDVQMPGMDGLEATRLIRALAPDLPVIGQTAHTLAEERARCLAAGMVEQISKPIVHEDLVAALQRRCGIDPASIPVQGPVQDAAPDPSSAAAPVDWEGLAIRYGAKPAFLERLAHLALERHREVPEKLRHWAAEGNLVAIGREAHALKGVAGNLMAAEAADLAQRTQLAAHGNLREAASLALDLATAIDRMLSACVERLAASSDVRADLKPTAGETH